jgi:glycosyltransferase involved in cell wall biosynthesis
VEGDAALVVTFVLPTLDSSGMSTVVVNIANALSRRGYETDILVIGSGANPYGYKFGKNARVIALNATYPWSHSAPFLFFLASFFEITPSLRLYFLKRQPRVAFLSFYISPILFYKKYLTPPTKYVVIEHAFFEKDVVDSYGLLKAPFIKAVCKYFYKKADVLAGVSKGVADGLSRRGVSARLGVRHLYNPVVTEKTFERMRALPKHPWLVDKSTRVVVSVGRLALQKDYATLLKAFSIVRETEDARLVIFAEGPERANLEALRSDLGLDSCVSMPGFTPNPLAEVATADVFVLSSIFEGLPTVLIEAVACGVTCVSTDCPGGSSEILESGKYGYLVPPRSPEALAQGIVQGLKKPFSADILKHRANDFSDDKAAQAYIDLINELERS